MLLISMLDSPGGISILGAPGINKREDCELQASGVPERTCATGCTWRPGKEAGSARDRGGGE